MTTTTEKTSWIPALAATSTVVLVTMDLFTKPVAMTALAAEFNIDAYQVQAAISIYAAKMIHVGGH